jgi:hypothetical protein
MIQQQTIPPFLSVRGQKNIRGELFRVISERALRPFEQAHEAASQCSGGPEIARALEDMLGYLEQPHRGAGVH